MQYCVIQFSESKWMNIHLKPFFRLKREEQKARSLFDAHVTPAGQGIGSDVNARIGR